MEQQKVIKMNDFLKDKQNDTQAFKSLLMKDLSDIRSRVLPQAKLDADAERVGAQGEL